MHWDNSGLVVHGLPSPSLPSRLMKYLRGMDRMNSGGIHQMHHILQVVARPTTNMVD